MANDLNFAIVNKGLNVVIAGSDKMNLKTFVCKNELYIEQMPLQKHQSDEGIQIWNLQRIAV